MNKKELEARLLELEGFIRERDAVIQQQHLRIQELTIAHKQKMDESAKRISDLRKEYLDLDARHEAELSAHGKTRKRSVGLYDALKSAVEVLGT